MKKIFTSVIALAFTSFGFAQSIHIYEGGVDVTGSTVYDTARGYNFSTQSMDLTVLELELHNTTSNSVSYKVNRTILSGTLPMASQLYFCTGVQCYSPNPAITWTPGGAPSTIAANSTLPSGPGTYGISAHYDDSLATEDVVVLYRVYNTAVAGDTAFVTVRYVGINVGIEENTSLAGGTVSAAYPNPSASFTSIKYDMNQYAQKGKIVFYDMLGKKVKEIELTEKQGIAKVDVSEFNSGIYFYSFIVNDRAIATKKLVVSSK
ncbi:MAG: hypothetical protein K0S44_3107 [Bacteroidetes bacterium]|jgi:hypothetical protein|nr:hypothetical protein [Bacteroidota bacterium]